MRGPAAPLFATAMAAAMYEDLTQYVEKGSTYCLNEDPAHPHPNVLVDNASVLQVGLPLLLPRSRPP